jgi:HK97 family phage prohead protease
MRTIERRLGGPGGVRLEGRQAGPGRSIVGLAAVFWDGSPDSQYTLYEDDQLRIVERIHPSAFDAALRRGDDVIAVLNHDENQLLGRVSSGTLALKVDPRGLAYTIDPPDTTLSRDVRALIASGDISGSSFAFRPEQEEWDEEQLPDGRTQVVRELRGVRLFDVSPVVRPAYPTTTAGLRQRPAAPPRRGHDAEKAARLAAMRRRTAEVSA